MGGYKVAARLFMGNDDAFKLPVAACCVMTCYFFFLYLTVVFTRHPLPPIHKSLFVRPFTLSPPSTRGEGTEERRAGFPV